MKLAIGRLHVITDDIVQTRFTHRELADLALAGGADTIQLRDKRRGAGELIAIASDIYAACAAVTAPFIVNDRSDIALAANAHGVHLGRSDLPVAVARRLLGPEAIIGATVSTTEEAVAAEADGANYVGFGHVFATTSKTKHTAPRGPDALADVCRTVSVPVIAIGGVEAANVKAVLEAGAWGVAVIGAVCAATDPRAAAAELHGIIAGYNRSRLGDCACHDAEDEGPASP